MQKIYFIGDLTVKGEEGFHETGRRLRISRISRGSRILWEDMWVHGEAQALATFKLVETYVSVPPLP